MENDRKVKGLNSQLSLIKGDAEALKVEISNKQKEFAKKQNIIKSLEEEIESLKNNGSVRISEHAIIRYFERVKGFDMAEIEKEIMSDAVLKMIETLGGNGEYPNSSFTLVLKNFNVVTIK